MGLEIWGTEYTLFPFRQKVSKIFPSVASKLGLTYVMLMETRQQ